MKVYSRLGAAALILAASLLAAPAQAQLLGGLLGGGDSGGGLVGGLLGGGDSDGGLVGDLLGGGGSSGGDGGGLIGNDGLVDLDTSGDGNFGVTGVATLNLGTNDGTQLGVTVLGGNGSDDINLPLGGLLGGDSGLGVDLPGLGSIIGGPGQPGQPGTPGAPGAPGKPGVNGINGTNGGNGTGINGSNGRNGGNGFAGSNGFNGVTINTSKLKMLLAILQNRAWLRYAAGNAVCLPGYGVAHVEGWLPQKDWGKLQQLVANYAQDIYTLRTMLAKCRSNGGRIGQADLNRVIGVDIRQDGTPVLFML